MFGLTEKDIPAVILDGKTNSVDSDVLGTSSISIPQIGVRDVPSISGGNVNKYTGNISYTYGIQIPAIRGNAGVGVSLNYSSRTIDDLRANKVGYQDVHPDLYNDRRCENGSCYEYWDEIIDSATDSVVGLGWSMSSFGSITIDSDYKNEYVLSVGGQNVRIKEENGKFFTYPSNKFLIERYGKWGAWKVTDTSGNVYFFGSIDNHLAGSNNTIPRNSANEYMGDASYGDDSNHTIYCWNDLVSRWNLSKISDIHGNSVEVDYAQKIQKMAGNCDYTVFVTPVSVRYNYSEDAGKYLNKVLFEYKDYDTNNIWDQNTNIPESALLNRVVAYADTHVINEYRLNYTKSFTSGKWNGGKQRRLLLTSISKKGFGGQGEQRPVTFCYKSLKDSNNPEVCSGTNTADIKVNYTPNDIYLVNYDNGYGGKVSYNYDYISSINKVCGPVRNIDTWEAKSFNKVCGYSGTIFNHKYISGYYRINNVIASNGLGQNKKTTYSYIGDSVGYASNFGYYSRYTNIPGNPGALVIPHVQI